MSEGDYANIRSWQSFTSTKNGSVSNSWNSFSQNAILDVAQLQEGSGGSEEIFSGGVRFCAGLYVTALMSSGISCGSPVPADSTPYQRYIYITLGILYSTPRSVRWTVAWLASRRVPHSRRLSVPRPTVPGPSERKHWGRRSVPPLLNGAPPLKEPLNGRFSSPFGRPGERARDRPPFA